MPAKVTFRHAPWSLSKVKCALRCSLEFHYRYVEKIPEREVSPEVRIGKAVHAALEEVLLYKPLSVALATGRKELLHEDEHRRYEALLSSVEKFSERIALFRARRKVLREYIEHRVAVRADLSSTQFFARDAYFRGVWDAGFFFDDGVLAVVDHKTGARRPAADFADQLEGYATLAAANLGAVKKVWLGVHFVADAAVEWTAPALPEAVRTEFAPRVMEQIEKAAIAVDGPAEPQVSSYCTRCSYQSICPAMRP